MRKTMQRAQNLNVEFFRSKILGEYLRKEFNECSWGVLILPILKLGDVMVEKWALQPVGLLQFLRNCFGIVDQFCKSILVSFYLVEFLLQWSVSFLQLLQFCLYTGKMLRLRCFWPRLRCLLTMRCAFWLHACCGAFLHHWCTQTRANRNRTRRHELHMGPGWAFVPDMAHGARCELVVYAVQHVKRCCAPCVIFLHRRCTLIVTFVLRSGPSSRFDHIGSYHSIWCDAPNRGCCDVIVVCCCTQFVLCTCVSKTNA